MKNGFTRKWRQPTHHLVPSLGETQGSNKKGYGKHGTNFISQIRLHKKFPIEINLIWKKNTNPLQTRISHVTEF